MNKGSFPLAPFSKHFYIRILSFVFTKYKIRFYLTLD